MLHVLYTPLVIPFIISLLGTIALAVYAFRVNAVPLAKTFAWAMVCLSWWTLCYIMELSSATVEEKLFWTVAKYPGATTGPVLWFILAVRLTRHETWLTPVVRGLLVCICSATCIVVMTNDVHHWYWTKVWISPAQHELQVEHGFYFAIFAAFSYIMVLGSVVLFFSYFRRTAPFFRRQATYLALGCLIPLAGRLIEDFSVLDVFPGIDNVILLLPVAGVCFALAIFHFGAFNIVPIAHDRIIHNIRAGIVVTDALDRVIEFNPYAAQLSPGASGTSREVAGRPLKHVFPFLETLYPLSEKEVEVRFDHNGKTRDYLVQVSAIRERGGILSGHALVLLDVTERKTAERELIQLSQTDSLTGLINRRHFYQSAEDVFAAFDENTDSLTVLMIDVDHFKQINDRFGHKSGDTVLRFVAETCKSRLRDGDLLGRYGGEEFVCMLPHTDMDSARQVAETIRQVLESSSFHIEDQDISLRASFGLAAVRRSEGRNLEYFLDRADRALYRAKAEGRNCVRVWEEREE